MERTAQSWQQFLHAYPGQLCFLCSNRGKILNSSPSSFLGIEEHRLRGKSLENLLHPDDFPPLFDVLNDLNNNLPSLVVRCTSHHNKFISLILLEKKVLSWTNQESFMALSFSLDRQAPNSLINPSFLPSFPFSPSSATNPSLPPSSNLLSLGAPGSLAPSMITSPPSASPLGASALPDEMTRFQVGIDREKRIVTISPNIFSITGFSPLELIGSSVDDLFAVDDSARMNPLSCLVRLKNGSQIKAEFSLKNLENPCGAAVQRLTIVKSNIFPLSQNGNASSSSASFPTSSVGNLNSAAPGAPSGHLSNPPSSLRVDKKRDGEGKKDKVRGEKGREKDSLGQEGSDEFRHVPHKRTYKYEPRQPQEDRACTSCGTRVTPEWRRGPKGPKTLCNACGLQYAKKQGKEGKEGKDSQLTSGGSSDSLILSPAKKRGKNIVKSGSREGLYPEEIEEEEAMMGGGGAPKPVKRLKSNPSLPTSSLSSPTSSSSSSSSSGSLTASSTIPAAAPSSGASLSSLSSLTSLSSPVGPFAPSAINPQMKPSLNPSFKPSMAALPPSSSSSISSSSSSSSSAPDSPQANQKLSNFNLAGLSNLSNTSSPIPKFGQPLNTQFQNHPDTSGAFLLTVDPRFNNFESLQGYHLQGMMMPRSFSQNGNPSGPSQAPGIAVPGPSHLQGQLLPTSAPHGLLSLSSGQAGFASPAFFPPGFNPSQNGNISAVAAAAANRRFAGGSTPVFQFSQRGGEMLKPEEEDLELPLSEMKKFPNGAFFPEFASEYDALQPFAYP